MSPKPSHLPSSEYANLKYWHQVIRMLHGHYKWPQTVGLPKRKQTEITHSFLSTGFNQLSSHWLHPQANIAPVLHYKAQPRPGTQGLQQS